MNHNKFTFEKFIETANYWLIDCRVIPLQKVEILVFKAVWFGLRYKDIAEEYSYSNGYITRVASKLLQRLSKAFGEKVSKTNLIFVLERKWLEDARAASTANIERDAEFTLEIFLDIANDLISQQTGRPIKDVEIDVLEGVWAGKTYSQIAIENHFCRDHVSDVGSRLWRQISKASGKKINKENWKPAFEQIWQQGKEISETDRRVQRWRENAQVDLSQNQTQLEARLVNSVDDARSNSTDTKLNENADDGFDVNRLVENVKNELGQMLSDSLDEHTDEANSQAASTAKSDRDFDLDALLKTAENVILQQTGRPIKNVEIAVLEGIWNNKKIGEYHYGRGHIYNTRSELFQLLSEALGAEVSITTCMPALKRRWRQDTQANLTPAQVQRKDCFFNFLLNPWNSLAKFRGNVENSWKFLVKDTANKIWQKLAEVWQEKVSPKNWQAALRPKLGSDEKLTEEIVLQVISDLIFHHSKKHLHYLQEEAIYGTWQDKKYEQIAEEVNCDCDYLGDKASELWQDLSKVFAFSGYKINKKNFKQTLEGWYENMRSSFLSFT